MDQAGAGLVAAVATTDAPPSTGVAPAAGMSRGGALVLHPTHRPCPRLGPSSTMAPLVGKVPGSSPRAVTPTRSLSPRLQAELSIIKWTLKVINFL